MRINQQTDYAIRTIIFLEQNKNIRLGGKFIVNSCDMPERWGRIILTKLCKAKIIDSQKGYNGGFILKKGINQITLYEIFNLFEEFDFKDENSKEYPYKKGIKKIKIAFIKNLKSTSLLDLITN